MADKKAQGESEATRTLRESEEIAAAGARRTPSTYADICAATEAYYCIVHTLFTADSELTKDYEMLHDTLQSLLADKDSVSAQTWRTLSWKMICNDAQYFAVLTSSEDVYNEENLPRSVLHFTIPSLRSDLALTMPANIPRQWTGGKRKKNPTNEWDVHDEWEKEGEQSNDSESEGWSDVEDGKQGWMTPHSETHPKVKEMMREYYDKFDYIMGSSICHEAGIRPADLKLGKACLNYILGLCTKRGCTRHRRHPRASDATDHEVTQLCKKLKKGVDILTGAKRRRIE